MMFRLLSLVFFLAASAFAVVDTVYLEISASGSKAIPVGVVHFDKSSGNWSTLDEAPHQILERDLGLSGRIEPLVQPTYNRLAFFKGRAAYYIAGSLSILPDGKIKIECRLNATQSQELVIGQTYSVPISQVRQALHDFADQVIFQISGTRGVSSSRLAYVSKINGEKQVFVADYDGHNPRQVTQSGGMNFMPSWGRTLDKLYFVSFRNGPSQIFERTLSTAETRVLFPQIGQTFSPAPSPVSDEILFTVSQNGSSDIWKGNLITGAVKHLTYQRAAETSPAWSPNGEAILYSGDRGGSPQIYIMDSDGSDSRRLTYVGRYNESAVWSPSGDRIAFTSMNNGQMDLFTCAIDGSDLLQLTNNAGNNEHPSWSPDGQIISFSSTRSGTSQIYLMRRDGSGSIRITNGSENTWPSWSPMPSIETPKGVTK